MILINIVNNVSDDNALFLWYWIGMLEQECYGENSNPANKQLLEEQISILKNTTKRIRAEIVDSIKHTEYINE